MTEYEIERNKLIPAAVKFADEQVGKNPETKRDVEAWSLAFHHKMNTLAIERFRQQIPDNDGGTTA